MSQNRSRESQFAQAFCNALSSKLSGWQLRKEDLVGPCGLVLRFGELHPSNSPGHIDIEIIFDEGNDDSTVLVDCAVGFGGTQEERVKNCAHLWVATTGVCVLELKYSLTGEFACHYGAQDPGGLLGWHAICGDLIGYGRGTGAKALQDWWMKSNNVLPSIAPAMEGLSDSPHGIKIFFGGEDTAEVRIDGEYHESASQALAGMDWPRNDPSSFLRAYVIAIHRG
jgi:hypothetical protein